MQLDFDIFDQKIKLTKDSLDFLKSKIENLSEGAKEMYLMEKYNDLRKVFSIQTFSKEDAEKIKNFNFEEKIIGIIKDFENKFE